jgi:hydrogenase expression/formation protein HypE
MTDLGKIDRDVFERIIHPQLGSQREDVDVGPQHGIDFGVLDIGEQAVVIGTDPISLLPELGLERAGALAIEIVLTDVAVSGIAPTHLAVNLTLPPEWDDENLAAAWTGIASKAKDLGVSIVSGHTARYPSIDSSWVGGATALGVGPHTDIVRPDGAMPGDRLVMTTGPAAEFAGLCATVFPEAVGLAPETVAVAQERVDDIAAVADARAAFETGGVTSMHDATEGGIAGGLNEMASGAGAGFDIDADRIPIKPGVQAVCEAAGIDPWHVTSAGTLLLTVDPDRVDAVVNALTNRGTTAAVVGSVTDETGVSVDGRAVASPDSDPAWGVFAQLSEDN